jgi:hypothetical protein
MLLTMNEPENDVNILEINNEQIADKLKWVAQSVMVQCMYGEYITILPHSH